MAPDTRQSDERSCSSDTSMTEEDFGSPSGYPPTHLIAVKLLRGDSHPAFTIKANEAFDK
jgi:hypothetical protein